ncbi:MAG TPA: nucleotide exchange factor GrpE [Solirubrobacteraceae bacterium]|jgi:molecular chaperone GrpE|nr:nucleotide exchange factor GrpE [Solirubrobacteraceae bacterium]
MSDSERIARQRSDEHGRSDTSPGARTPGEEKPPVNDSSGRADGGGTGKRQADDGRAPAHDKHGHGAVDLNGDAAEVAVDLDELVKTAAERDEYLALAQRTQADFENYRKRVARESAAAQARGCILLAKELLPALDNLDRALEAAAKDDPLLDGVRIVRSELSAALARTGIESFSPAGEVFDPSVHEAVATSEQPADGAASGTVVEVYQPGYRLGETIIRPARVVVAA